jgi:hypothetical protein
MTDAPRPVRTGKARRFSVGLLVVVATLSCWIVGVTHQDGAIRAVAAVVALAAMAGSLALARNRGNILGWYVITVAVALLRVVTES